MATKSQLATWTRAQGINPTGMSNKQIEAALDRAAQPQPTYMASESLRNNGRMLLNFVRDE